LQTAAGNDKFPAADLEALYKKTGLLDSDECIILHAQEYMAKPEKPAAKRRKSEADPSAPPDR